ncbi:hypothetical protein LCGC14_0938670 [marine sediment metagenome]|uniref:Uncharacterized protein n=1 Tax=marine sediment metagenome TaxID=412755 RepID=A0A0F9NQD0_9ZZZZ
MTGAYTTLKVAPADHQALLTLLGFLAGKVTEEQFRAVLQAQGRTTAGDGQDIAAAMAEMLIRAFS